MVRVSLRTMAPQLNDVLTIRDVNAPAHAGNVTLIPEIAALAFDQEKPVELDWFLRREQGDPRTYGETLRLAHLHETSWALAQLFYDQTLKHSAATPRRMNLAHPAFGVAQLATQLHHPSAELHYAMLAQLADVLGERDDYKAGAFHMLSNRWGRARTEKFIEEAQSNAATWNKEAVRSHVQWPDPNRGGESIYPEALLAMHWMPSHKDTFLAHARIARGAPFVRVLLDAAKVASDNERYAESGTLFEAAASLLLSTTPGFNVRGGRKDPSSQTDIAALYLRDAFCEAYLPEGYALVECKHWAKAVDVQVIREFSTRLRIGRHTLGIIVTLNGLTGEKNKEALEAAELVRHDLMVRDGIYMLCLSKDDFVDQARALRGLEGALKEDLEQLRFGRRY
jgi:hypothetical protein